MLKIRCPDCDYGRLYINECGMETKEPSATTVACYPCPRCKGAGTIELEEETKDES